MKKYILFTGFICLAAGMYAQSKMFTLSGYVRDSLSGEALAGVAIRYDNEFASTNEYGFYTVSVRNRKELVLVFDHIGYKSVTKSLFLEKDTPMNIRLVQTALELGEVVVRSGRPRITSIGPLGKTSVNTSQLKYIPALLGEPDIFKYLQMLPGVTGGREASSGLNIRGGSADQSLVLLDDIPIYNQSHGFGFLSVFSGEAVKSAELYKGYVPPEYGGRLSGIASVSMREGSRNDHRQSLQIGTTTASVTLEGSVRKGKGSYLVSGRYFIPDLLLRGAYLFTSRENSTRIRFGFYDVTAKTSYDLNTDNTLYLSFYTGHDALVCRYDSSDYDPEENILRHTKSSIDMGWGNVAASGRLSSRINGNTFLKATLYYSFMGSRKVTGFKEQEEGARYEASTRSRMEEAGAKIVTEHSFSGKYELTYGLHACGQFFRPRMLSYVRKGISGSTNYERMELYSLSMFVNNRIKLNRMEIQLGMRGALFHNTYQSAWSPEPRVSLAYNWKSGSLWAAYTQNKQALFSMNQYYLAFPVDYWVPYSDSRLLPRSNQVSLGYRKSFGDYLDLSAEGYYKRSRSLSLIYDSDDYLLGEGGYDKAAGKAYGIEVSVQYQRNRFSLLGTYSWSSSQYHVNGKWVPFIYDTPHDLNLFGTYEVLRRSGRTHTLSANIHYKTGLPYVFANDVYDDGGNGFSGIYDEVVNNSLYPNARLKNFFRTDLNYSMEKKLRKGSRIWQISVMNATAHKNPYAVYRTPENYFNARKYTALILIPVLPSFSYKRIF